MNLAQRLSELARRKAREEEAGLFKESSDEDDHDDEDDLMEDRVTASKKPSIAAIPRSSRVSVSGRYVTEKKLSSKIMSCVSRMSIIIHVDRASTLHALQVKISSKKRSNEDTNGTYKAVKFYSHD